MARIRIGEILVKQGLLTESQLQEAISMQGAQKGSRLGEILIQVGTIKEEDFAVALGIPLSQPTPIAEYPPRTRQTNL